MSQWIVASDVRDFANIDAVDGRYSDAAIGSNIMVAQGFVQRETGRQFDPQSATTKTFSSNGAAQVSIPDLRSATSVTRQGAALTADASYWLLPDAFNSGVFVGLQLRAFTERRDGPGYLSNPEWYDRNLDHPRYNSSYGLPNDLAVTGDWGWDPIPHDVLHAVKAYAAWLTKRGDALLANAVQNVDGTILDYSRIPEEMATVIRTYRRGTQAVAV